MRCERAKRAILERPLNLLSPAVETALEEHLRHCPACAADAAIESCIDRALDRLRVDYPLELDVARGVMMRIRSAGARREDVEERQLVWGAVAATLAALVLAGSGARLLPLLPGLLQAFRALTAGAATVLVELAEPLIGLLEIPFRLFRLLLAPEGVTGALLQVVPPLAGLTAVLSCTLVLGTAVFVIGRDIRRFAPAPGVQEYRSR